ncbi:hypothetical protein ONS95_009020 [Cadophora gregata]|uniref:uncharacterized protein n=1 Tax=Cadophora gregata TaxID=51156 RepID=UPI0026DB609C|nr:uncharacterized protein ONS95_009020 [Cadophora gregata]KAK0124034.1 hypothetical protein ONS95_009020 [Cadophora gregata]
MHLQDLTVGYVAGVIAAAIFVARVYAPSVLTFILSAILRDQNSAATWTVASATLNRSYWPNLLQSDGAKNHGVRKDIIFLTYFISLMGALIAIAGIVTPLGLFETLVSTDNVQTPFRYLKDSSPFGYGTPQRSNFTFNRKCGDLGPLPCPYSDTIVVNVFDQNGNGTVDTPYGYNMTIPDIVMNTYSSGVGNDTTISNYFDIQWRRYQTNSVPELNNGSTFLVGAFRPMQSLALNSAIQPVEGLIVDTINGGVGFRNHTVPPGFKYGASWEEDILFIEPETVCVDTNTTLDFTIAPSPNISVSVVDLVLTDRGGFVNINKSYPLIDLSDPQKNPKLYERAWKAAWMTNAWTMLLYNITNQYNETTGRRAFSYLNSTMDKKFAVPSQGSSEYYDALIMDSTFMDHLNIGAGLSATDSPNADARPPRLGMPGISSSNFSDISLICSGSGGADFANITNIFVTCGIMRGIPQRLDAGSNMIFEANSRWTQPIYSCATAVKATIKTVSFTFNGTENELSNLNITKLRNKEYPNDQSRPLWGVEDTGNYYAQTGLKPIWGLVSSDYENNQNVSVVRQDSLYLPGYQSAYNSLFSLFSLQNLPASEFFLSAAGNAYTVGGASSAPVDYSGGNNMAMWARWRELSANPINAAQIPNIVFTDYAAASVVGTKGVLGPGNAAQQNLVALPVSPTERRIRYRWPFAIPAFIVALMLILMSIAGLLTLIFGHGSLAKMRAHLHQSSTGRIFTTFLYPEQGGLRVRSRDWSKRMGTAVVDLSGDYPMRAGPMQQPEKWNRSGSGEAIAEGEQFLGPQGQASPRIVYAGAPGEGFGQPQPYTGVQQHTVPAGGK